MTVQKENTSGQTTAYNPRSHWSEDDLTRTHAFNRTRISALQRDINELLAAQTAIETEVARRSATDVQ